MITRLKITKAPLGLPMSSPPSTPPTSNPFLHWPNKIIKDVYVLEIYAR